VHVCAPAPTCCAPAPTCCESKHHHHASCGCGTCNDSCDSCGRESFFTRLKGRFNKHNGCCDTGCNTCNTGCNGGCGGGYGGPVGGYGPGPVGGPVGGPVAPGAPANPGAPAGNAPEAPKPMPKSASTGVDLGNTGLGIEQENKAPF